MRGSGVGDTRCQFVELAVEIMSLMFFDLSVPRCLDHQPVRPSVRACQL